MTAKDERNPAPSGVEDGNSEEARHLAEEALEERRNGNEEEARFVIDEARELDPDAVDEVLKKAKQHRG